MALAETEAPGFAQTQRYRSTSTAFQRVVAAGEADGSQLAMDAAPDRQRQRSAAYVPGPSTHASELKVGRAVIDPCAGAADFGRQPLRACQGWLAFTDYGVAGLVDVASTLSRLAANPIWPVRRAAVCCSEVKPQPSSATARMTDPFRRVS
jgi:hypothetical protein